MKKILWIFCVGILLLGTVAAGKTDYFEVTKNLDIFATLYKELNSYYVDDVDPNELIQEGIDAMLESLDPYTNYISEAEMENYRFQTTGKYGGIGSLIQKQGDYVVISEPYKDYPADKAGMLAGDKLVEIDGQDVKGKNSSDVSELLKGEPGTSFDVKVLRLNKEGDEEEKILTITRDEVQIKNVPYFGMVDNEVGYIRLSNFTQKAGKEVEDALKELKEENPNLAGVVLDVRGNPGGLLNESVNIVNVFIEKGQLVCSTKGKISDWDREFKTLNSPIDTDIPLAVLTSRGSASASEIVSGSIQDLDRGVVIGQKTFGKGLVQTTRPLTYNSSLKVTTAKYYIPSGRCIQAINYAERDEDGAVSKLPDSLKVAFQTNNGRTVYDGGGVDPDVAIDPEKLSDISIALIRKDLIFDYATVFKTKNESIAATRDFRFTDAQFEEFSEWLADKDYDYETDSEKLLEELEETSEEENYYDAIKDDLEAMKEKMHHDKKRDLEKQKEEIKMLLETELATRYYYRSGSIETSFKHDEELKEAINILKDKTRYEDILAKQ